MKIVIIPEYNASAHVARRGDEGMDTYSSLSRCKKCGCIIAKAEYRSRGDVLKRTCERCGYVWLEEPLDSVPTAPVRRKHQRQKYIRDYQRRVRAEVKAYRQSQ